MFDHAHTIGKSLAGIVLYRAGHYIAYFREGTQWYSYDDLETDNLPKLVNNIQEVPGISEGKLYLYIK